MHETYDAVNRLIDMGFWGCYLILDDHPPVRRCHSKHLNVTIPEFLAVLDATYIGLNGWGQNRLQCNGDKLGVKFLNLENVTLDFKYKFSLHPAFWNLQRFAQILKIMIDDSLNYGPWRFEKFAGLNIKIPIKWRKTTYRVSGIDMSKRKLFPKTIKLQHSALYFFQKWFPPLRIIGYYYEGPYPIIRSGLVKKGKPNDWFLKYLIYFGKWNYYLELKKALSVIQK
ncbi:MAG: hypothetical protein P1P89_16645 [Desulfobacterales bacterium]|nr:hypothetical protein [Desulfobacterales bacterium]